MREAYYKHPDIEYIVFDISLHHICSVCKTFFAIEIIFSTFMSSGKRKLSKSVKRALKLLSFLDC